MTTRYNVNDTGIFATVQPVCDTPDEQWQALVEAFSNSTLEAITTTMRRHCADVLADVGHATEYPYRVPTTATPIQRDAAAVLMRLHWMEHYVGAGDAKNAAWNALQAGWMYQRVRVRPAEPHAKRGRTVLDAARVGHRETHGTSEQKADRWAAYQRDMDALRERNPKMSYAEACRRVADKHNVKNPKTVDRHTVNRKPRKPR